MNPHNVFQRLKVDTLHEERMRQIESRRTSHQNEYKLDQGRLRPLRPSGGPAMPISKQVEVRWNQPCS